jgi:exodeoxyribonuclease V alpha subunit
MMDIDRLHVRQVISHLDYYFAVYLAQVFSHEDPLVKSAAALTCRALADGNICLDLKTISGQMEWLVPGEVTGSRVPDFEDWMKALMAAPMVGRSESSDLCRFPLVLDSDGCLYLSKYYDLQTRLVQALAARIQSRPRAVDPGFVHAAVEMRFRDQNPAHTRLQKQAVITALQHNFTVISGGPGTGKTHITRIIRDILSANAHNRGLPAPRFLSLAPTGRAASRLPDGATIHSVLIPRKNHPGFIHGKDNLLAADVVIIDEASMIDMALMTRLLEAIPLTAGVILLGDDNQLSPVQAGAVFTDICTADLLRPFVVSLTHNFRSHGRAGIEILAHAIRRSDVDEVTRILTEDRYPDMVFAPAGPDYPQVLENYITDGYGPFMQQQGLAGSLDLMDRFRILCAHNIGEYGTLQINHLCEKLLRKFHPSDIRDGFLKQMIMISANDYGRGLFNGDTGVVLTEEGDRVAGFTRENGRVQTFRYMDLPSHDPAFAVTIHKSQGSEFETVLIVIPDKVSRVMTRQLLYTGITRARKKAVILGSLSVIREAMGLTLEKRSRLSRLLVEQTGTPGPGPDEV